MFPDAGVSAAVIVGGVALVSNWRTQRMATAAIQAAHNGPMTDRWVSAVKLLAATGTSDRSIARTMLSTPASIAPDDFTCNTRSVEPRSFASAIESRTSDSFGGSK